MSSCPDICTAAKCAELEARIGALEQGLALLQASFEAHTQQEIPEAHNYQPPDQSEPLEPEVTVGVFEIGEDRYGISVQVGSKQGQDEFTISHPDLLEPLEPEVTVGVFEIGQDRYGVSVQVGSKQGQDEFTISHPDLPPAPNDHVESNLSISASYFGDILTISVADGESQDTATVFIDAREINNFGGGGSDVSCDNLSQEFQDCCNQILAALNSLSTDVQQVFNEVTIDITGTVNTDYKCEVPATEDGEIAPTVPEPILTESLYSGIGLRGIHANLKTINANLDSIFEATCVEAEPTEVVSIVASDGVINRARGKKLILHFVTFENYPKRAKNSTYWSVQIPAARETYTWNDDFKNLIFRRGNQFAQMTFNEFSTPVKGYFADEDAANQYFSAVLSLTTATEKNRVIPKHSNPQTAVLERDTRPYRAFIEYVNSEGQAVCEMKYVPPKEDG